MEKCLYDSGDSGTHNGNLQEKISRMRSDLHELKTKLYLERAMLEKRKREIFKGEEVALQCKKADESEPIENKEEIAVSLDKTQLRDIDRRCQEELEKLNDYIVNVNRLKNSWLKMRENAKEADSVPRATFPRGKVFYVDTVDSDLY